MQGALCIMYSISNFYFTFYLFRGGGVVHTQRTPCLRACAMYSIVSPWLVTSWRGVTHSHEMIVWMYIIVVIADRLCVLNLQIKSGIVMANVDYYTTTLVLALANVNWFRYSYTTLWMDGSVAEWLACWTQVQLGLGSNHSSCGTLRSVIKMGVPFTLWNFRGCNLAFVLFCPFRALACTALHQMKCEQSCLYNCIQIFVGS